MGNVYLTRMLGWYLSTDKTFLFHLEESGQCMGYCGGMVNDGILPTGSASGMAQYSFKEAIQAFLLRPWLLLHPEVLKRYPFIWRNLLMKLRLKKKNQRSQVVQVQLEREPQVGLVVIGVDPAYQGKGYGSMLLQEFERQAIEVYGIHKLQLTVKANNTQAIKAYERNGWYKGELKGESLSMMKIVQ
ncbi:MAG: GNAT family N-acetyltransferase [Saprospiraceae bacterium]|nr:GNAT family N-acetyltransferase [Saprospiraceae bacterium]